MEGVGLFVSDPALVVLIEMVPGILEVGIKVSWDLSWLKLMGRFENGTGGELGIILHEEFLASLVSGWSSSFLAESGEDVVHNFIFVGSVIARNVHIFPGGLVNVSAFLVGIVKSGKLKGVNTNKECCDSENF